MKRAIPSLLAVAIISYLAYSAYKHRDSFSLVSWNFNVADVTLLFVLSVLVYVANTLSWHILCKSLGIDLKFRENSAIWMISNVSRLIPGGVWQYPSRVLLLSRYGISKTRSVAATMLEGLLTVSSGAAVVMASLPFMNISDVLTRNMQLFLLLGALSPVAFVLLLRTTIVAVLLRTIGFVLKRDMGSWQPIKLPASWIPLVVISFIGRFLLLGWGLFVLASFTVTLHPSMLLTLTGVFALSWLVGYIAFFSPGGLGVTEASLSMLLSPYFPLGVAIAIAIAYRLVLMTGEGIYLWVSLRRVKRSPLDINQGRSLY